MSSIDFSAMPDFVPVSLDQDNRNLLIQQALDTLLHSRDYVPQDALICLEVNRVFLGNGGFVISAFRPRDRSPDFPHMEFLLNLQKLVMQVYNAGIYYAFPLDGQLVVLSCFPRLTPAQNREPQLLDLSRRMVEQVTSLCLTYWHTELAAVVGPVVYTVSQLSSTFFFVTDLMEYKLFTDEHGDCFAQPAQMHAKELVANLESFQKRACFLANDMMTGAPVELEQYAAELVDAIIGSEVSSQRNIHISLLLFVQKLSSELQKLGVVDTVFLQQQDMLGRLLQASTRSALVHVLAETLIEIQLHIQHQEQKAGVRKLLAVKDYIDRRYTDPALSLNQAAEVVGLHYSTVSSRFKKQFGRSAVSYIQFLRVARAKELLADPRCTLSQAAALSGFGSLNSMYRAFRAQEGLPPGQLRNTPKTPSDAR